MALAAGAAVLTAPREPAPSPESPARTGSAAGRAFLDQYVEPDGRVTRHDQGGDTVSEGQAYGLLIALTENDKAAFRRIWGWTRSNLQRTDGLLAWHWGDGRVLDRGAATDADLDSARALVLAGHRFSDGKLSRDGQRIAAAVLDHETVVVPQGRLLIAGDWADRPPYWFNPSYVSPAATDLLRRATGDPRWRAVEDGSRAATYELTNRGYLPPDWARVDVDGTVTASPSPGGQDIRYGYDAARVVVRHAESCQPVDQEIAASSAGRLALNSLAHAELELDGTPLVSTESPLAHSARAAAYSRAGWRPQALAELDLADTLDHDWPSYYGAAWAALGRRLLTDPALESCPPLEAA
jgi:YD repeat-containing protein